MASKRQQAKGRRRQRLSRAALRHIQAKQADQREAAKQQAPTEGEPTLRQLRDANQERLRKERGQAVD